MKSRDTELVVDDPKSNDPLKLNDAQIATAVNNNLSQYLFNKINNNSIPVLKNYVDSYMQYLKCCKSISDYNVLVEQDMNDPTKIDVTISYQPVYLANIIIMNIGMKF
jgi:hypothetical protein